MSTCKNYYILLWLATSIDVLKDKMNINGIANNDEYKIMGYSDILAMTSVNILKAGFVMVRDVLGFC